MTKTKVRGTFRGMSTSELHDIIRFRRAELDLIAEKFGAAELETSRYAEECRQMMAAASDELCRRQEGGRRGPDIRQPAWSDGERIAAGMEPLDDAP